MIKNIKRVGIIFLAVAIICLMVVGCLSVNSVASIGNSVGILSSDKSNSANSNMNNGDANGSLYNETPKFEIPQAEKVFLLDCDSCGISSPCTCGKMAEIWSEANQYSINNSMLVKIQLERDWFANNEHSFGEKGNFFNGGIEIAHNAKILLDLNGKMIDRGLTKDNPVNNGAVIYINGELHLMDSHFNSEEAKHIYNGLKSANNLDNLKLVYRQAEYGIITGGSSNQMSNGGGIRFSSVTSSMYMYGGIICNNFANQAGGIFVNASTTFYMYDGIIANNEAVASGGGIFAQRELNILGGMIVGNKAGVNGGGIICTGYYGVPADINIYDCLIDNNSARNGGGIALSFVNFNMYSGFISENKAIDYGSGIYAMANIVGYEIHDESICKIYGGTISNNVGSYFGGGITITNGAKAYVYDCEITGNETEQHSSAILVNRYSELTLNSGKIYGNISKGNSKTNNNAGAVVVGNTSKIYMNGGHIDNNLQKGEDNDFFGAGISLIYSSRGYFNGGIISNNVAESNTHTAVGSGIYSDTNSVLNIGGPIQVYGNKVKGKTNIDSDCYLQSNKKINIDGKIFSEFSTARIGIDLSLDYTDTYFTNNFSTNNSVNFAFQYFFSNLGNRIASSVNVENGKQEISFISATGVPTSEWIWEGEESGRTTLSNMAVPYTGEPYVIKNSGGTFSKTGITGVLSEISLTNAGSYSFDTSSRRDNAPVFVFTILPKEVDVLWNNTNMVYNGGTQKPTAYIAEDSNCKVTIIGEQINSGYGYVATATGLSNTNYKINSKTMNKTFSIAKAKLQKPNGSGSYEYNGEEHTFEPNGYNFVTMNISGNKQTEVGSYNAVVSIKDKLNYMWADGTNADVTIPYAITLAPPVNEENGVYRFIYYDEADGTRKTYKEGGLVHGINDSEVNGGKAIIGNIAPNTSVKVFIENLGFDTNNIQLFAGNKLVYDKTNGYVLTDNNYDNGRELAVGTGWYINYTAVNGEVETIYLSVLGDLTGDGKVNSADVNYLRQIVNNNSFESLSAEQKLSALIVNKGKEPTSTDAQILWEAVCGRIDINEFI